MKRPAIPFHIGILAGALAMCSTAGAANFVVTTTADTIAADGQTSLSEAMMLADASPGADTITFSNGAGGSVNFHDANQETITLVLGEINVCGPVTITGPGAEKLSISGGNVSRIFDIADDDTIITALTIRNGKAQGGGAIFKDGGTLTMSDCVVKDSDASLDCGGGIYVESGRLELTDCTVSGNKANEHGGGIVAVSSPLILVRCLIEKNSAATADGEGIYASNSSVTLTDCTISENIGHLASQGIYTTGGTLIVTDCIVEKNQGDGIGTNSTVATLQDCAINENSGFGIAGRNGSIAITQCSVNKNAGGISGGNVNFKLTDSTVNENTEGGGLATFAGSVNLIRSKIELNQSNNYGGGMEVYSAEVTITDCVINGNEAKNDGGGIWAEQCAISVKRSTISGNRALGMQELAGLGAGIFYSYGPAGGLTMTECTVSGNTGIDGGAGIHSSGGSTVNLIQCTLNGNTASSAQSTGGAIYADSGNLILTHCTLDGNVANSGGSIYTEVVNLTLANSILSNSTGLDVDLDGTTLTLNGKNIVRQGIIRAISNGTGQILSDPAHLMTANPHLGPLESNGGLTKTQALLSNSPAIDAGDNAIAGALLSDQRGIEFSRIVKGNTSSASPIVDIGAYESQKYFGIVETPTGILVRFFGTAGTRYTIQSSENLKDWPPLLGPVIAPASARIEALDNSPTRPPSRFYRAVETP